MENLYEVLKCDGWHIKESVVSQYGQSTGVEEIVAFAINTDLSEIGEKYLQEKISSVKDGVLTGPCVVQVGKIRNISAPKENESSNFAPRMLRLALTDGSFSASAIEVERIEQISLSTVPGTKVKLIGSIPIKSGLLHLQPECIKVLGGKVPKLYLKWQVSKEAVGFSRSRITADGAPSFIEFGKQSKKAIEKKNSITKSLKTKQVQEDDDKEFSEQRKAAIAEIIKETPGGRKFETELKPNFGKKHAPDIHHGQRNAASKHPANEQIQPVHKVDTGLYRELSTDSGENVNQKFVNEFVEMGFKREDVIVCMRKCNNEFERTMDMLLATSGEEERTRNDYGNGPRNKIDFGDRSGSNRGGRRGRRGGGRGRGRERFSEEENMNPEHAASSATLFDFLESKMSAMTIPDDRTLIDQNSRGHCSVPLNQNLRYDSGERYDNNRDSFMNRNPAQTRGPRSAQRGNNRNSGDHRRNRHDHHRQRGGRRTNNFTERRSDTPQDEMNERKNSTYQHNYDEHYTQYKPRNQMKSSHLHESKNEHTSRYNADQGNNYSRRNREYPSRFSPSLDQMQRGFQSRRGQGRRFDEKQSNRKRTPNQSKSAMRQHGRKTEETYTVNDFSNENTSEQEVGYNNLKSSLKNPKDTIIPPFPDFTQNPRPAQMQPTTFGIGQVQDSHHQSSANKPQSSANKSSSNLAWNHPHDGQQIKVSLPQWQQGSLCLAKYWEDRQFYEALIVDIHPTALTAVVKFTAYGNYEEVEFFNLRSLLQPDSTIRGQRDSSSSNSSFPANSSMRGMTNRIEKHHHKPPIALYVPPSQREDK